MFLLLSGYLFPGIPAEASGRGLHTSPEEVEIWRQRAGIDPGERAYRIRGDVQENSPGDWVRIWLDGDSAVNLPGNDRFTNYDTSRGMDSPITELNSPWVPDNSYPARVPYIDDKEPRPNINRKDYGAISAMNAGFLHLLLGDDEELSGISGLDYAKAVRDELIGYANNPWLDFSNELRWVPDNRGFADRNPGFFIACWLNSLINAYDYSRGSSAYSEADHAAITEWFIGALNFFYKLKVANITANFPQYTAEDYSVVATGGTWYDRPRGPAWEGSEFVSYGFNEAFSNRSTVQWRLIMRGALLLREHPVHGGAAQQMIRAAHRWFKEWIVFGCFREGTFSDFHRGGSSRPHVGLHYSSVAIGAAIDMADAYERLCYADPGFESLYDWEIEHGSAEFDKMVPDALSTRPWYGSFIPGPGGKKGFRQVLRTYAGYFDGTYGTSRSWGGVPIDGHTPDDNTHTYNWWLAPATTYYREVDPELADYLKAVYTRTAPGTVPYSSSTVYVGSYMIDTGSWGSHPATLFMFGKMDGKVWPYDPGKARGNPFAAAPRNSDGWKMSGWFDWLVDGNFPWIYHLDHQWIYVQPASTASSLYFVDATFGWMWTSEAAYPFLFNHHEANWMYYLRGTRNPRWFWNFVSQSWESDGNS